MWIDFRISFWKIVVLYEIYRENWKHANTFVHCLYICIYRLIHHVLLSSVERRTINDQEATFVFVFATDSILVHGVFIMFFFLLLLIYNYSQLYHLNANFECC